MRKRKKQRQKKKRPVVKIDGAAFKTQGDRGINFADVQQSPLGIARGFGAGFVAPEMKEEHRGAVVRIACQLAHISWDNFMACLHEAREHNPGIGDYQTMQVGTLIAETFASLPSKKQKKQFAQCLDQWTEALALIVWAYGMKARLGNERVTDENWRKLAEHPSSITTGYAMNTIATTLEKWGENHEQFTAGQVSFLREPESFDRLVTYAAATAQVLLDNDPVLQVREDVAISLMLTDARYDPDPSFCPWDGFFLQLPTGLIKKENGEQVTAVMCFRDKFEHWTGSADCFVICETRFGRPGWELARVMQLSETQGDQFPDWIKSIGLLLIGLLFLLEQHHDEADILQPQEDLGEQKRAQRIAGIPDRVPQVFFANPSGIWGDDLEANKEYLRAKLEGRKFATPRWLRRGHWRRQRVGVGRSQVKIVRVAPAWCQRHELN